MPAPAGPVDAALRGRPSSTAFHAAHERLYGYSFAGRADQRVEWVNLRVTGVGPIRAAGSCAERAPTGDARRRAGPAAAPAGWSSTPPTTTPRCTGARDLLPGDVVDRPGRHRGVRLDGAGAPRASRPRVDGYGNLRAPAHRRGPAPSRSTSVAAGRRAAADPVLVEIVEGTLASVEKEVETAIGRTSRSPMIRDAHDFRAGIHDRAAAQADRPLVQRARAPGGPRLPARHDAPRRRVLPQRRLRVRGRHRPPARPVRHRAGLPRRRGDGDGPAGGRVRAGVRPPRRHRRRLPRARCRAARRRCSRRA